MRSSHSLDRIGVAFDGTQLVADAGLLAPATLAQHLGLKQLVNEHVRLGKAAGRANAGDKLMTLVASALAGGDCIDDAVRHEAPYDRVGGRSPPLACRSRPVKLGAA
jgi:hypothetical protein